jgi:hypothetical protein
MVEVLKVFSVVLLSAVVASGILAKLYVMFAQHVQSTRPPVDDLKDSAKSARA